MPLNEMTSAAKRVGWTFDYCEVENEFSFVPIWTNARGVVRRTYHTYEEAQAYLDGLLAMETKADEEAYVSRRNDSYGY